MALWPKCIWRKSPFHGSSCALTECCDNVAQFTIADIYYNGASFTMTDYPPNESPVVTTTEPLFLEIASASTREVSALDNDSERNAYYIFACFHLVPWFIGRRIPKQFTIKRGTIQMCWHKLLSKLTKLYDLKRRITKRQKLLN